MNLDFIVVFLYHLPGCIKQQWYPMGLYTHQLIMEIIGHRKVAIKLGKLFLYLVRDNINVQ